MVASRRFFSLAAGLLVGAGCSQPRSGPGAGHSDGGTISYASVSVTPSPVTLMVPLAGGATQPYRATAMINGSPVDVTAQCNWSLADPMLGHVDAGALTTAALGGHSQVLASCGGATGSSDLTLVLTGSVVVGIAPANAAALFQGAQPTVDPARTPTVEYPLDGALAPANMPTMDMQWSTAANDLFHLKLASPHLLLDAYTILPDLQLDDPTWSKIIHSSPGDAILITVEGLGQVQPLQKFVGPSVTLKISHDPINNSLLYWWASSKGSIMSQTFGATSDPTPVIGNCTACHSLSRSGTRMGYSRCVGGDCGAIAVGFRKYDSSTAQWIDTMNADQKQVAGSYTTFAPVGNPFPDDSKSVALVATSNCTLSLYDPDLGQAIASNVDAVSTHGASMAGARCATMPDWSANGSTVAFASTPNAGNWVDVSGSAIATMSYGYTGGVHSFGEPQFIVQPPIALPSGMYVNFFFPSFSPDGKVIVFNAARANWRDPNDAKIPAPRLMLTSVSGDSHVDLANLNGAGDFDLTWPHWAPTPSADYFWIAFASELPYGHKLTPTNSAQGCLGLGSKQCKQIWIGAVDRSKLNGPLTSDPSAPPVWMPGQLLDQDSISPYWTVPLQIQ